MGQLIYGATIVHRKRKGTLYRGNYSLAQGGGQSTAYGGVPPQFGSYAGPPADPFRNPSQNSFGAPHPRAAQPSYANSGAAGDYYHPQSGQQAYEMHGSGYRA